MRRTWRCAGAGCVRAAARLAPAMVLVASLAGPVGPRGTARAAAQNESPRRLGLAEAVRTAFERSPTLAVVRAEIAEARGRLDGARTYDHNPRVELRGGPRLRPGGRGTVSDYGVSVTQRVQLGGKRDEAIDTARAATGQAEQRRLRTRRRLAARTHLAFAEAVRARELLAVAEARRELAGRVLETAQARLDAGEGTRLELQVAKVERGRAARRVHAARAAYRVARTVLAERIGLPLDDGTAPPAVDGEVPELPDAVDPLGELVTAARTNRADLEAARRGIEAARTRIRLAESRAIPDLDVGAFARREANRDTIVGLSAGIEIPVVERNPGEVAEARARRDGEQARAEELELAVAQQVASARARLRQARAGAEALEEQVVGGLADRLDLLREALRKGQIGISEVLVMRRQILAARRELVEARTTAWQARVELDLAAGRMPLPEAASDAVETEGER